MTITLNNGQTVTIYEKQNNLLRQLEPYIDKEIYKVLEDKYGFIDTPLCENGLKIITNTDEIIGETIKYCNLINNGDLDDVIIATNEGSLFIGSIVGGDEYSCASVSCIKNEAQLKYKIFANRDVIQELLENNIIDKEYINKINQEREERLKKEEEKRKEQKYKEYLKLKEEFEKENK